MKQKQAESALIAKVLIVDDLRANILALEAVLDKLKPSVQVMSAMSGVEALKLVQQHEFAVILMDVCMPSMDGFETVARIKTMTPEWPPVIFITATEANPKLMADGYQQGAFDFIFKPLEPATLLAKVKLLIQHYLITQRSRQAEAALRQKTEQLEEAVKQLESFSYTLSHDLKAPLRTINGFASMLIEDVNDLPADKQKLLREIANSAGRMGSLIEQMLKFAKLGQRELVRKKVPVGEVVQSVIRDHAPEIVEREADVRVLQVNPCDAEPVLIRQVFSNLLSNALKYSRKTTKPVIEIGCIREPNQQVYFVRDNGIGFQPEHTEKLFQVFQRLHKEDEYEGDGIGLATVKRIIERHGGRAWASSDGVGQGATFFFSLPEDFGDSNPG